MKVHLVEPDYDENVGGRSPTEGVPVERKWFDGSSREKNWLVEDWYFGTLGLDSNFVSCGSSVLCLDESTKHVLTSCFDLTGGELLPIRVEGATFWIFNITNVLDAIDEECSERRIYANGITYPGDLVKTAFHKHRLAGELRPFLLERGRAIFVVEDKSNPDYEQSFFNLYRAHKLSGLKFIQEWEG